MNQKPTREPSVEPSVKSSAKPPSEVLAGARAASLLAALAPVLAAVVLAACASTAPPARLYQLRAEPPAAVTPPPAAGAPTLQLLPPSLPELLERDAILVSQGLSGVAALPGHRWAEPLRDAVPRLLRQDLALWLGLPQVWAAPVPAGVTVQRQLRVEVLALQADAERRTVSLQARWTLSDPGGATPPLTRTEAVSAPVQGSDVDALAAAHRAALWRLAEAIASGIRGRAAP